jgi:MFS transporter, PAT family, beta-lactamase induction signal transducer AmpG
MGFTGRAPEIWALYANRRMIAIFGMGIASGLPLLLTTATLSYWLAKSGVDKTAIGLFALVGLPYSFKFVWAPALDHVRIPGLGQRLGQRRSWALVAQLALIACILGLGATDPAHAPWATARLAVALAFFSATQDIAIDAYRIEVLVDSEQGAGAAATQTGYRIGLLLAGAGAIALADFAPWRAVFAALAAVMGIGIASVLLAPSPPALARATGDASGCALLERALLAPLRDFTLRPMWAAILAFAMLYKFGDAVAGVMANKFYVDLGFSGVEIASVTKVLGLVASIGGVLVGGVLVSQLGIFRALALGGLLQVPSLLLFAFAARLGHDLRGLALAVGADSFSSGIAGAALVAYLSSLCRGAFTATQYALLTSLMAAGRTGLASGAGWLAAQLDWASFFSATALLAAPGLLLLFWIWRATRARVAG